MTMANLVVVQRNACYSSQDHLNDPIIIQLLFFPATEGSIDSIIMIILYTHFLHKCRKPVSCTCFLVSEEA